MWLMCCALRDSSLYAGPDGCEELLDVISAGGGETLNIESAVNFTRWAETVNLCSVKVRVRAACRVFQTLNSSLPHSVN